MNTNFTMPELAQAFKIQVEQWEKQVVDGDLHIKFIFDTWQRHLDMLYKVAVERDELRKAVEGIKIIQKMVDE